jgi:ABC-2 type transport system ATP-binding protein
MTVVLNGVAKSYGPVRAVRDVDLTIPGGGMVALFGPNGAGKSTTIGMLAGLIQPDAGRSPSAACHPPRRYGRAGSR